MEAESSAGSTNRGLDELHGEPRQHNLGLVSGQYGGRILGRSQRIEAWTSCALLDVSTIEAELQVSMDAESSAGVSESKPGRAAR